MERIRCLCRNMGRLTCIMHPHVRCLAVLALAALTCAHAPAALAQSPGTPSESTEVVQLPGLRQPVEILVDRWGVPHIFAENESDLFFAQGFNAARDRLFQLDLWRRRGLGQLAEVLGPRYVEQDRAARLFLYRGDMEREWRAYSSKNSMDAARIARKFAAGINAYIDYLATRPGQMPWEFRYLGYEPSKWAPADVVRIRSHGLTRNLLSEVARARTTCAGDLKADEIRSGLQPAWETRIPEGLDSCLPRDLLRVFQLATAAVHFSNDEQSAVLEDPWPAECPLEGSNNWVVAPVRSATGRAILANDPHRAYSVPSLRYIVHLAAPGLDVIGAGEPILPGISIGHNGTIAFGLTIFPIDQDDLYVYELQPGNPGFYRYRDSWEPLRTVREQIRVKGNQPVFADLAFTKHGPVIYVDENKRRAFGVRSCWFEPGMSPYFRSIDSMRARDFAEFKQSLSAWGAPTLNHVYADVKGNIGWLARGRAPRRPDWDGLMPVPADGHHEWNGFWAGEELPSVYNPPEGWFATANQMNLPGDYPYRERKLGFEWANPSRFERISEVLAGNKKLAIEDCQRLQNDIVSIPARRIVRLLENLVADEPGARAGIELLKGWDFREGQDSAPAALFEVWQARHLRPAFRAAVLPPAMADALPSTDVRVMIASLEDPALRFGDDAGQRRNKLLLKTLAAAYEEMEKLQGPDPRRWQWGRLQQNFIEHPLSGLVGEAMRRKIDVGPLPRQGGEYTPNQSGYRIEDFQQTSGPSFRIIVDVGNWDNSRAVNHPGQSGNPDSPHYRDLAPLWLRGEYFPLLYSRGAIERAAERRIRLVPQGPAPARDAGMAWNRSLKHH
jgi:penicillin G amidase